MRSTVGSITVFMRCQCFIEYSCVNPGVKRCISGIIIAHQKGNTRVPYRQRINKFQSVNCYFRCKVVLLVFSFLLTTEMISIQTGAVFSEYQTSATRRSCQIFLCVSLENSNNFRMNCYLRKVDGRNVRKMQVYFVEISYRYNYLT